MFNRHLFSYVTCYNCIKAFINYHKMKDQFKFSLTTQDLTNISLLRAYIRTFLMVSIIIAVLTLPLLHSLCLILFGSVFLLSTYFLEYVIIIEKIQPSTSSRILFIFIVIWINLSYLTFLFTIFQLPATHLQLAFLAINQILLVNESLSFLPNIKSTIQFSSLTVLGTIIYLNKTPFLEQHLIKAMSDLTAYMCFAISRHKPIKNCIETASQSDPNNFSYNLEEYVLLKSFDLFPFPVLMIDIDINPEKCNPPIFNKKGKGILSLHKQIDCIAFLRTLILESTLHPVIDQVNSFKRKVEQPCLHKDRATVTTNYVKYAYDVTLFTTEFSDITENKWLRYAVIVLHPITQDVMVEKQIMENFKGSLICSLSHELCTPMNTILNALRVMPSCPAIGADCDLKEVAISNTELLNSKLHDLIDYTQIELGSFRPVERNFCVDTLFTELQQIFKFETEQKHNKLITETNCKGKLWIMADKCRIRQVLIKLITNANKYTSNGKITVKAVESSSSFDVSFQVKDAGCGISKQQLDLIFSNISEAARLQSNQSSGSTKLPGLGLAIARRICDEMNSKLKAKSIVGKGSMFYFDLPICKMPAGDREGECCEELTPKITGGMFKSSNRSISSEYLGGFLRKFNSRPMISILKMKQNEPKILINSKKETYEESKEVRTTSHKMMDSHKLLDIDVLTKKKSAQSSEFPIIETNKNNSERQSDYVEKLENINKRKIFKPQHSTEITSNAKNELVANNLIDKDKAQLSISYRSIDKKYTGPLLIPAIPLREHEDLTPKTGLVLVVDDYAGNRLVLVQMLEKLNIQTIQAENGSEACKAVSKFFENPLQNKFVELILMDLDMPVMNGAQATMKIRALENKYKKEEIIPIVAVTAFTGESDKQVCLEAGMQIFLSKPVSFNALKSIVKTYCKSYKE